MELHNNNTMILHPKEWHSSRLNNHEKMLCREIEAQAQMDYKWICDNFYVPNPRPLYVGFFLNTYDILNAKSGFACPSSNGVVVMAMFSLAELIVDFNDMMEDTCPHEIAHDFLFEFDAGIEHGHDQMWIEVMQFFGFTTVKSQKITPMDRWYRIKDKNLELFDRLTQ